MKKKSPLALLLLAAISMFISCGKHNDPHDDPYEYDGVNWDGSNSGTLELINGSNKDMVLFIGQTPAPSNLLGGVRAGVTTTHDISGLVSDFSVGGYAILRGVSKDEYDKYAQEPSKAKIEFTAMVTYGSGKKYRYNIDRSFIGDYGFKVVNNCNIGIELRKDSPNGEKVAYLPAMGTNNLIYTQTQEDVTLFPVYVFFNKSTGEVSTLNANSLFETITASPRGMSPNSSTGIQTYYMPNDPKVTWESIKGTLKQSAAYVTIVNGVYNQSGRVTIGVSNTLTSQNGFPSIGSGEKLTYEIESTDDGIQFNLILVFYAGKINIPVRKDGEIPLLRNGYDYSVSVNYLGGSPDDITNYTATITESAKPRDISDQIESL